MSQHKELTVNRLRDALLNTGRIKRLRPGAERPTSGGTTLASVQTPWLTPKEAAERARCGVKTIYREAKAGRLRAARVGGRRELRIKPEWIDEWLLKTTAPPEEAA
jgi:excisionase family DNA binding protein